MSIPRPGARRRSVAEVMDSVFWEYHPQAERHPGVYTVAEFFEAFEVGVAGEAQGEAVPRAPESQELKGEPGGK